MHPCSLILARVAGLLRAGIPEGAGLVARVADEDHGNDEDQRTNCARFSLQEESREIKDDEHDVVVEQRRVHRLGQQQDRYQPLKAVHGGSGCPLQVYRLGWFKKTLMSPINWRRCSAHTRHQDELLAKNLGL